MFSIKPIRTSIVATLHARMPTRAKLYAERLASAQDRIADSHTRGLLVHLNSRFVRINPDDLCTVRWLNAYFNRCMRHQDTPPTSSS